MIQQPIIAPIPADQIEAELTPDKLLRKTGLGGRLIYTITAADAPHTMQEIGRLREWSFRLGGGGTGKEIDIDAFDAHFKQLIVWCPQDRVIIGGYRYLEGSKIPRLPDGSLQSPTAELFQFSPLFETKYLPHAVELGRSFVQPDYQFTQRETARKSLYSLDNLWDGLGGILSQNPDIQYYFGKVTMYPQYQPQARDLLLRFLQLYCPDVEGLLQPRFPVQLSTPPQVLAAAFKGNAYTEDFKTLVRQLRDHNETIPPLIHAYMNLSPSMKTFGTSVNETFGYVEETGILITLADVYESKRARYLMQS